jgi:hypothetical protein
MGHAPSARVLPRDPRSRKGCPLWQAAVYGLLEAACVDPALRCEPSTRAATRGASTSSLWAAALDGEVTVVRTYGTSCTREADAAHATAVR